MTHTGMAAGRTQPSTKPAKVQWTSAGSHKDENDIWRGGVALGTYGEAVLRLFTVLDDCRGWGRYQGRIYQGRGGKRLVVVVVYAPDALYEEGSTEGNYSQRLGERAKASGKGVTADKWKPKAAPPKPTVEQVKHPKRLLWADLEMHLRHYAYCKNTTLILMGDLNTDVVTKKGKDESELVSMMDKLRLTSCAAAAWPESHVGFKTWHKGGRATHIDYILMTSTSISALRRFGIHRNEDFPSSIDHSSMFIDIDVGVILGVTTVGVTRAVTRSKSQIRYGDKPRVARFREFADRVLVKERLGERMERLIGTLSLTDELREEGARDREEEEAKGWGKVNWCATEAEADSGKVGWTTWWV